MKFYLIYIHVHDNELNLLDHKILILIVGTFQ